MATQPRLLDAARTGLLPLIQGSAITDNAVTPVQATEMPMQQQQQVQQPWYDMKPGGGKMVGDTGDAGTPWYKNPNVYNALALGFNSMRLNPDQGLAQVIGQRMKTAQEMAVLKQQSNATADYMERAGRKDLADLIRQNPSMAKDALALMQKAGPTEAMRTLEQRAAALNLEPGSEEYNAFMAGGKPGDVSSQAWEKGSKIRGEFMAIPAVKDFSLQSQAFGRITASADEPSAAGDLALIFNFMKILDPGSTVREGEFATAQNAGGVDQRVYSLYNQIINGQRLTPDQRSDFLKRADKLYGNAEKQYSKTESFFNGLAERSGLTPTDVLPNFRYAGTRPNITRIQRPADVDQDLWDQLTDAEKRDFINQGA